MVKFAYDGITSFSYFPLKMATYLGVFSAFAGFVWGIYAIYQKYIIRKLRFKGGLP